MRRSWRNSLSIPGIVLLSDDECYSGGKADLRNFWIIERFGRDFGEGGLRRDDRMIHPLSIRHPRPEDGSPHKSADGLPSRYDYDCPNPPKGRACSEIA